MENFTTLDTMGERLRRARVLRTGLDQDAFAAEMGISRRTVGNYENGRVTPSKLRLLLWAQKCGTPASWLVAGSSELVGTVHQEGIGSYFDMKWDWLDDKIKEAAAIERAIRKPQEPQTVESEARELLRLDLNQRPSGLLVALVKPGAERFGRHAWGLAA